MNRILGNPNVFARSACKVTALGPEPVVGDADKLKNSEPNETARILSRYPNLSRWRFRWDGDPVSFQGLALVNSNLSNLGYFRITSEDENFELLTPTSITAGVNITGGVSRIENAVDEDDGIAIDPTITTAAWSLIIDNFNSTGSISRRGEAMGLIVINVLLFGTPVDVYPTVKIELRESGGLIRSMGYKAVTDKSKQIMIFPFDPNELASPDLLVNIQAKFYGYPGDNGSYCALESMNILYSVVDVTFTIDSANISCDQRTLFDPRDGVFVERIAHYVADAQVNNNTQILLIMIDDGCQLNPPLAGHIAADYANSASVAGVSLLPQPYVEIGSVTGGPVLDVIPGTLLESYPKPRIEPHGTGDNLTPSGQNYYGTSFLTWATTIDLPCTRAVCTKLVAWLYQHGRGGALYIIFEPDLDFEDQILTTRFVYVTGIQYTQVELGRTGKDSRADDLFIVTLDIAQKQ